MGRRLPISYVSIQYFRVRPLSEKERRGLDSSVVSFPGNGQILVNFIFFLQIMIEIRC